MKAVYRDDRGSITLNTDTDAVIISVPRAPPGTGTKYMQGYDLYVHRVQHLVVDLIFYVVKWDIKTGTELIYAITKEEAAQFIKKSDIVLTRAHKRQITCYDLDVTS